MLKKVDTNNILGESPLWDAENKMFYWIDLEQPYLYGIDASMREYKQWKLSAPLTALGLHESGGFVGLMNNALVHLEIADAVVHEKEMLSILLPEKVAFNDGKVDAVGRFWAGTKDAHLIEPHGSLFRFNVNGTVDVVDDDFIVSNGLGWSPDNRFLYATDSIKRIIYRYDFNLRDGTVGGKQSFIKFAETDIEGFPDGMSIDSEGNIWVALWKGGRVVCFTPAGEKKTEIVLPVPNITSCCFGGEDLKTLFITTANYDVRGDESYLTAGSGSVFMQAAPTAGKLPTRCAILVWIYERRRCNDY